ncbi:MAG: magnesium transporter, partial [Candidatus Hydrothermota bacterium]
MPELKSELEKKNLGAIKELLKTLKPQDIAELVEELEDQEKVLVLRLLDKETIAHIFSELPPQEREELFRLFTRKEVADLLNELDPDDRARFFDELPAEMVKKLLTYLKPEEREVTQILLNYPPDSVGHAMTPEMVELKPDMTVEDALKFIRENAPEKETIYV